MKKLPIGIQTFEEIIQHGYVYIDKTRYIYELICNGKTYFVSRPRRFGKSLMCSTLEQVFLGNKELFKGLWIYDSDYKWEARPVIRIDMSDIPKDTPEEFKVALQRSMRVIADRHGVSYDESLLASEIFKKIIEERSVENKVAIIIDEYDAPILKHVTNLSVAEKMRDILQGFYSVLKSNDEFIEFVFITGISKFSHVSIFSVLNNLFDLTVSELAATMFGYTQDELESNFVNHIEVVANKLSMSTQQFLDKMREWYNGYRFSEDCETVYNPYSILYMLRSSKFRNFWFQTGTPSFLIDLIDNCWYGVNELEEVELSADDVDSLDIKVLSVIPILHQAGYLTIKDYNPDSENYTLVFPNREVRVSFLRHLLSRRSSYPIAKLNNYALALNGHLASKDVDSFCKTMQVYYAGIPYDVQDRQKTEQDFQLIFFSLLKLLGFRIIVEDRTNIGRIDAVIDTPVATYLLEFKVDQSARSAMEQIENKQYYEKFMLDRKPIILIGVNFDIEKRNLTEWEYKEIGIT